MNKLGKYFLMLIGVLLLSSVTVFDPAYITDKILGRLVRLPEGGAESVPVHVEKHLKEALDLVTVARTRRILSDLTSWGARAVGYPGNRRACEYIKGRFEEIGLERVTIDTFKVTVPIDKGARLRIRSTGEEVPLYCLWPNNVKTPTLPEGGITGNLIYGRKGDFKDLNGKRVEGSIVLLDFDCDQNYINAPMLGAKAVIFFDNGVVNQKQAADKFLKVPADIPRYWVEKEDVAPLLRLAESGQAEVTLTARMDWEEVETWNVYAYLSGSEEPMPEGGRWKDQLIVVEAYYDAISVVPRLATGAENACGVAALLQLAQVLKQYQPKYSVLFLATSAHFQGLAGINDFLHRHSRESDYFLEKIPEKERIRFKLFIGLDLSSHNDQVAAFSQGAFYHPTWQTDDFVKNTLAPFAKKFAVYAAEIFPQHADCYINAITPPKRSWKDFVSTPPGFDSEAVVFVGKHGISLATPNDAREKVDTPLDRIEYVNAENLTRQTRTVAGLLIKASEDINFFPSLKMQLEDKAHDLKGHVYWWNPKEGFTPNTPVAGAVVTYQLPEFKSCTGVRRLMVTLSDQEGGFHFKSIRQEKGTIEIRAYKLDEDGKIVYAPDMGWDGNETYPIKVENNWWDLEMMEVLFRCQALTLFEIIDSRYFTALDVLNLLTADNSTPIKYGYSLGFDEGYKQSEKEQNVTQAAVVFGRPGSRVKILMGTSLFGIKYLLSNAPEELLINPISEKHVGFEVLEQALGQGYDFSEGVITWPAYKIARDMWVVDDVRLKALVRYGVRNERIESLHQEARKALLAAKRYKEQLQYDKAIASARKAWGLEARGYPDVKSTANDTVRGIIFYFALLLPFSFFMERLLFGAKKITKQIIGTAGIFVAVFMVLQFVHPAFKLSTSPYVIFLGFVILALGLAVLAIVVSKFNQELKKMKRTASGVYEADVGRVSATMAAVILGINNLRKRPLRTSLTATTLILLTFTVLSFTSIKTSMKFYKLPRGNKPPYQGGLIRDRNWRGLQNSVLEYTQRAFQGKATTIPRAWYIAKTKGEKAYIDFEAFSTGQKSFANGLLGLTPQEIEATKLDRFLVGPKSRWFKPGERKVCILPTDMGSLVGITPEDVGTARIKMLGSEFRVIGLIDAKKFNQFKDLDDEKLTPVDTVTEGTRLQEGLTEDPNLQATAPIQAFQHLEARNIMILPYRYVMDLGGTLRSVVVTSFRDEQGKPKEDFLSDIEEFMLRVALTMFVGKGDKVQVYSSLGATSLSGVANLVIPILIVALIVLNTMLGSVYERHTEIGIYSSVGLAPVHIGALFLAEAAVYATLGAVGGYLVGQVVAKILMSANMLSGISLNYSSLSAVWSTVVVMSTVFLSTIYPAKKAAAMSVPDVTRKWILPEPKGDDWRFDFPFTVGGTEALGMYVYLSKVFDSYGEGSIGDFTTENVRLSAVKYNGADGYRISLLTWLAPYDLGVSQDVTFDAIPTGKYNIYRIEVHIHRLSGEVASWKRLNRGFLSSLRKRFLVWRTVSPDMKQQYTAEGRRLLGER